jgi:DNA-binding NarL/FixJ family response regulator
MRWRARAGRETVTRMIRIRIVATTMPVQRVEIVLAGPAAQSLDDKLGKQKPKVVTAEETTFDAAANRNCDVRVIVVDVDEFGVGMVRDLHTVFPTTKIVALAAGPKTMAAALKAGATIVLPRSTPPATLAKIVQRLAKKKR